MSSPFLLPAMALAAVLLGGGALFWGLRLTRKHDRTVSRRVDLILGKLFGAPKPVQPTPDIIVRRSWRESLRNVVRLPFLVGFDHNWGITLPTIAIVLLASVGAVLTWLFLRHLFHMPVWVCLAGAFMIAPFLPRTIMRRQQNRADERFLEHFPDTIDMVVRMVRSGLPVAAAIRSVSGEAAAPVGPVLKRVADRADIGMPLEQALSDISDEIGIADFRFLAVTVALQRVTGGNLARTLEASAEIVRKRRALRLKAKAATAEVRLSAIVLASIPFVTIGALLLISPGYLTPLVSDPRGNVMIGLAALSLIVGGLTMRRLVRSVNVI